MELLYFIIASFLVVIVPGPTVSLIISNTLRCGVRAGLLNILGTQFGVLILIFLLALGFKFISPFVDQIIKIVRIFGAIYLIILGMITFKSKIDTDINGSKKYDKRFIFQGLIVILTNPKIFLFLGSFLPQFISLDHSVSTQIIYFGLLFILVATIFDSCYAIVFGKFRNLIANKYLKILNAVGGSLLIFVGVWLVFY